MSKALPSAGIVGAVTALLSALVLVDGASFLVAPVALGCAIVFVLEKSRTGILSALVVVALTAVATMGLMESITREGGETTDFGMSHETGRAFAVAASLAIAAAVTACRWNEVRPGYLRYLGLGAAALATLIAFANRDTLLHQQDTLTLLVGALALATTAPLIPLLRSPAEPPEA